MRFFDEFRKEWAVDSLNGGALREKESITISLNNEEEGSPHCTHDGSPVLFRYFDIRAISSHDGLHLLDDASSHICVKPALGRAQGSVARKAMTYEGFSTLFVLTLAELLRPRGLYYLHSACLREPNGRGWLICGWPGSGKTTLSLGFLKSGFSYLSDDAVLLNRVGQRSGRSLGNGSHVEALSLRKTFRVAAQRRGKRSFRPETRFNVRYDVRCIPGILIHATVSRRTKSRLLSLTPVQSFLRLIPQSFQILSAAPRQTKDHADVLKGLAHQCMSFDLTAGADLLSAPERLYRMVREELGFSSSDRSRTDGAEGPGNIER